MRGGSENSGRWQLVDDLTARLLGDQLTEEKRQVYEFLTTAEIEGGSAAELFQQFTEFQAGESSAATVTSEAEFEAALETLITEGRIEADFRVSTEPEASEE